VLRRSFESALQTGEDVMGWRFYRRFKLPPGVDINLSKRGTSVRHVCGLGAPKGGSAIAGRASCVHPIDECYADQDHQGRQ
jgi:uncharacterized protein DUF4236